MNKFRKDLPILLLPVAAAAGAAFLLRSPRADAPPAVATAPAAEATASPASTAPPPLRRPPSPFPPADAAHQWSIQPFQEYVEEKRGLVLDARSDARYREGHVPDALSLPAADFEAAYSKLKEQMEAKKEQSMVAYCSGFFCRESDQVQKKLAGLGSSKVTIFKQGWGAWQSAGLPHQTVE